MKTSLTDYCAFGVMGAVAGALFGAVMWFLGVWTASNIEFWAKYFGNEIDVPVWLAILVNLVTCGSAVIVNILSEVAELFVA